jgi:hypothetical protein
VIFRLVKAQSQIKKFGFDSWNQIRKQNQVLGFLRTRIETRTQVTSFLKEKNNQIYLLKIN